MSYSSELKKTLKESKLKKKCCRRAFFYGEYLLLPEKKRGESEKNRLGLPEDECFDKIDTGVFRCPSCRSSFMRGVFCGGGTVSDPQKSFHFEIKTRNESVADDLYEFICANITEIKRRKIGDVFSLYLKKSEDIEDIMHYMGAGREAFEFTNEKIKRNILNQANRRSNFEVVNIQKTVDAAQATKDAINKLKSKGKMSELPKGLAETAKLRLDNPIASLEELAALHSDRITKSGVNHRLKKLIELAEMLED